MVLMSACGGLRGVLYFAVAQRTVQAAVLRTARVTASVTLFDGYRGWRARRVERRVAKAESLPFDAGSVALVVTVNALHWFRWESFFAEVRRLLADGGVFCPSLYRLRAVAEPGLEDCLQEVPCTLSRYS
ncbi:hypothetical protein V5799_016785 [Amblyomma americanum]|uniref:Methyltransferase type 11 domain-containing protein n=1 Tax=Amblyomma americanum TaxID=6943 RepID=A0AAQ4F568_AMBAM